MAIQRALAAKEVLPVARPAGFSFSVGISDGIRSSQMTTTIANSNLPVARPAWDSSRPAIPHCSPRCGVFHRAHCAVHPPSAGNHRQRLGYLGEVNLMPGTTAYRLKTCAANCCIPWREKARYTVLKRSPDERSAAPGSLTVVMVFYRLRHARRRRTVC